MKQLAVLIFAALSFTAVLEAQKKQSSNVQELEEMIPQVSASALISFT